MAQESISIVSTATTTPLVTKVPSAAVTMLIKNKANTSVYFGLCKAQANIDSPWVRSNDANSLAAGATALVTIATSIFVPTSAVGPVPYSVQVYLSVQGDKVAGDDQNYGPVNVDVVFN